MSKIQDEGEITRWFNEGRTYRWMVEEYERKYNITMTQSAFSNFRHRRGLGRRITRNDDLIPWAVNVEHRWAYDLAMLRMEARRRNGAELNPEDAGRLASWRDRLDAGNLVLHYDPDTEEGFWYVPRRPGVDLDLIREPEHKTTQRRLAE